MRHRLFGTSLFLAAFALVACGAPFAPGSHEAPGGGDDESDGGSEAAAVDPDAGTVIVGPPHLHDGGPGPIDATTDAREDADAEAVDANDDATLNETPDASFDAADSSVEKPDTGPACSSTEKLCGDQCVLKTSAATGCAATSCTPCSLAHTTTATCDVSGECASEVCAAGYEHCSGPASGGCETSISTPTNCGSCGHPCDSGNPYCAASGNTFACTNGCPVDSTLCNSTCVNETTSTTDCGGCTTGSQSFACTAPTNGSPTCSASKCSFSCNVGFNECNNDECVSFTTDPKNCGSCNHPCAAPTNGSATCAPVSGVGTCGIACNTGFSACNGACVNEQTDNSNCGACNKTCGAVANGTDQCTSGNCKVTCATNYSLCDTDKCVNESSDDNNCGACDHACPSPPAFGTDHCVSSSCTVLCNTGYQLCNGACVQADPAAVFVSSSSSATSGCGAIGSPCKTIAAGLSYAAANGKSHVYVDQGTYAEQVTLVNGVTLEGGWIYGGGTTWTKECVAGVDQSAGTIIAPLSVSSAVLVKDVTATLINATVHNQTTATAGESLFGIFAASTGGTNDTKLTMSGVEVLVAKGGNGAAGAAAIAGSGTTSTACGSPGSTPAGGASGTAGPYGTYSAAGYATPSATPAETGGTGGNGACGAIGTPGVKQLSCDTYPQKGCSDPGICSCGGVVETVEDAGVGGAGGPGGNGGGGGGGGSAGGASIALYAWNSTVIATGGSLSSSAGGTGGPGSVGATGAAGGVGQAGTGEACYINSKGNYPGCTTGGTTNSTAGGVGKTGGTGATGGTGGGGAGGDSYGYYSGGSASVTVNFTPTHGAGGAGGAGASLPGHSGPHN